MSTIMDSDLDEIEAALMELSENADAIEGVIVDDGYALSKVSLDEILAGYGLRKGDNTSRTFVKSKEIHRSHEVMASEREARERRAHTRRVAIARQRAKRAERAAERDAKPLDQIRMRACLALLGNLTHVITNITMNRYNRFRRVLGDVMVEDIAQDAILRIAESLARAQTDIVELAGATMWLKTAPQPYESVDGPQGARLLLGTIVRVVSRTIVDTYRDNTASTMVASVGDDGKDVWTRKDTTLESWEYLSTIESNIAQFEKDGLTTHFQAKAPHHHESAAPGMREKRLFARMVIDTAITARGLDALADMFLDDERTQTTGAFRWQDNADAVWNTLGLPALNTDSVTIKAHYARRAARLAFAFLPETIEIAYGLITSPEAMWYVNAVPANRIVQSVAPHLPSRGAYVMIGGESLEYTMHLLENKDAMRRALLAIAESDLSDLTVDASRVEWVA